MQRSFERSIINSVAPAALAKADRKYEGFSNNDGGFLNSDIFDSRI
jgi:hypothetical protein